MMDVEQQVGEFFGYRCKLCKRPKTAHQPMGKGAQLVGLADDREKPRRQFPHYYVEEKMA